MSGEVDHVGLPSGQWCGNVVDEAAPPAAKQHEGTT
jgi:hypothetical protein